MHILAFVMLESSHIVHFNLSRAFTHINYYRNLQLFPLQLLQAKHSFCLFSQLFANFHTKVLFPAFPLFCYCHFKSDLRDSFFLCLNCVVRFNGTAEKIQLGHYLISIKELKENEYFIGEKFLPLTFFIGGVLSHANSWEMNQWRRVKVRKYYFSHFHFLPFWDFIFHHETRFWCC